MRRPRISTSAFVVAACLLLGAGIAGSASAQTASPPIHVIKVEGAIDGPLLGYLQDQLDLAVEDGAVVVLQMDTSGTIDEDGAALAQRVAELPVPVLTWVGPVPARASGAGMLLMLASSISGVAPGSQTGPLHPVDLLHPDEVPSDLDSQIVGWLASRGRTVDLSTQDVAMTAQQALDGGYAEVAAPSVLDFLDQVDGREVQTPSGPVVLHTAIAQTEAEVRQGKGVQLSFIEPGPVKRVQHAVASPTMVFFLLVFGLACLAFEVTQPGFGFAGFAGLFLTALGVYGAWVVPPTSWLGMAMLVGGMGLLVLDVQLRRLGVFTAVGLALFLAGSIFVYGEVAGAIRISPWLIGGATVAAFLYFGFGLTVAVQSRDRILSTQRGLIGLTGEARGRLAPDGPVYVKGALWRGRSLGDPIAPGATVRVRGVEGLILKVEAEHEPAPTGDAGPD
jgi:membrane-bound serine protease (ClpP class)